MLFQDGQGKEKGRLVLKNVRLVEKITDNSIPQRSNGFQVSNETC